jgi:hypothetical protein
MVAARQVAINLPKSRKSYHQMEENGQSFYSTVSCIYFLQKGLKNTERQHCDGQRQRNSSTFELDHNSFETFQDHRLWLDVVTAEKSIIRYLKIREKVFLLTQLYAWTLLKRAQPCRHP